MAHGVCGGEGAMRKRRCTHHRVSERNVGAASSPWAFSASQLPTCAFKSVAFRLQSARALTRQHEAVTKRRRCVESPRIFGQTQSISLWRGAKARRSRFRGPRDGGSHPRYAPVACRTLPPLCLRSSIASAGDDRGVRAFGDLINDLSFITVVPVDFAVRRPSRRAPSLLRS